MAFQQADVIWIKSQKDAADADVEWIFGVNILDDSTSDTLYREYRMSGESLDAVLTAPNDAAKKVAIQSFLRPLILADHAPWQASLPDQRPSPADLTAAEVSTLAGTIT